MKAMVWLAEKEEEDIANRLRYYGYEVFVSRFPRLTGSVVIIKNKMYTKEEIYALYK
jgi:hypothetical protein